MAYSKIEWNSGDVITAEKLNHIEEAVEDVSSSVDDMTPSIAKIDNIESTVEDLSAEIVSARNYNSSGSANTLGGRIDELVRISKTQPGGNNEIWVNSNENTIIQTEVPTYQEFNNLIVNQNEQPSAESNRIWIPTSGGEEVEVPDMEEFNKLKNSNAPEYSNNAIYAVGEYVFYNGNLYRCQTAITTAEAWTPAHWTQVVFGSEVRDLKSAITSKNSFDIFSAFGGYNDRTHNGVVFTAIPNGFRANRTSSSTATAIDNIYNNTAALPPGVVPGSKVFLKYVSATTEIGVGVAWYSGGSMIGTLDVYYADSVIDVPATADGVVFRAQVLKTASPSNAELRVWLYPSVYNNFPYQEFKAKDEEIISNVNMRNANYLADSDLDLILDDCFWILDQNGTYTHRPEGTTGAAFFSCSHTANSYLQVYIPFNPKSIYLRRKLNQNAFTEWYSIIGGNEYNNEYVFNEYNNSNTVYATPSITTDTNNYLSATGDDTDVTANIVAMLTDTGVCNLGPGKFYVSGVDMPKNSIIRGCGNKTEVVLAGTGDGYAIKLSRFCTVKNLSITGKASTTDDPANITLPETIGGRHGILWQGDYTSNPHSTQQPANGKLDNLYIHAFTGGGITCYDTGLGTSNMLNVTNVDVWNCFAGINISYYSEFHKFSGVKSFRNTYGCINNGGNNVFTNCDFSNNVTGFMIDNSAGQSPNNSHGTCAGCVFNHSNDNTGVGIKVLNAPYGFIFDACQIFFSQIYIEDSDGIVISNSNFGSTNCSITIDGGGVVLFNGNMYQSQPTITITDNNNVHFANCYVRDTGTPVSAN